MLENIALTIDAMCVALLAAYALCIPPAYGVGVAWLWAIVQSGNTTR